MTESTPSPKKTVTLEIDPALLRAAIEFLARCQVRGSEAYTLVAVTEALKKPLLPVLQPAPVQG